MFTEFAHPILRLETNPLITPFCKITNHYLLTFAFLQDLVSRLIVLDPSKRLTARQCLEHPWVQVSPQQWIRTAYLTTRKQHNCGKVEWGMEIVWYFLPKPPTSQDPDQASFTSHCVKLGFCLVSFKPLFLLLFRELQYF